LQDGHVASLAATSLRASPDQQSRNSVEADAIPAWIAGAVISVTISSAATRRMLPRSGWPSSSHGLPAVQRHEARQAD
jgi:hypothetical protein